MYKILGRRLFKLFYKGLEGNGCKICPNVRARGGGGWRFCDYWGVLGRRLMPWTLIKFHMAMHSC